MTKKLLSVFAAVIVISLVGLTSGSNDAVAQPGTGAGEGNGNFCNSINPRINHKACVIRVNDADDDFAAFICEVRRVVGAILHTEYGQCVSSRPEPD